MKKTIVHVVVAGLILGVCWTGTAQQKDAIRIIMKEKLDKSKSVIEGLR